MWDSGHFFPGEISKLITMGHGIKPTTCEVGSLFTLFESSNENNIYGIFLLQNEYL